VRHRTSAYLNNRLEQDHRGIGEVEDLDSAPHLLVRDAAGVTLLEKHWPDHLPDPFAALNIMQNA
jgi:hypothetical protein